MAIEYIPEKLNIMVMLFTKNPVDSVLNISMLLQAWNKTRSWMVQTWTKHGPVKCIFLKLVQSLKFHSYNLPKGTARLVWPESYRCIQFNTQFILMVMVLQRAMTLLLIFLQLAHYKAWKMLLEPRCFQYRLWAYPIICFDAGGRN